MAAERNKVEIVEQFKSRMNKQEIIQVQYWQNRNIDSFGNPYPILARTEDFKLTGRWGLKSEYRPATTNAGFTVAESIIQTMEIEIEVEYDMRTPNPDWKELSWYETRILKQKQQPTHINEHVVEKVWVEEDAFIFATQYDPLWEEFSCHEEQ